MLTIYDITIDLVSSPMAASVSGTRFSWKLNANLPHTFQKQYRVRIFEDRGRLYFDSGEICGRESVEVSFASLQLAPASRYTVEIEVTDNHLQRASAAATFETELPAEHWVAKWIKPLRHIESHAPYLRKKFVCNRKIASARLYASGLGCAEYYINGRRISDDIIDPPMTNYTAEVLYRVFDVTAFLEGENCLAAHLGDGWYSQSRVWATKSRKYGDVCLCAELHIAYEDGSREIIPTDDSWRYIYGPVILNNLYGGETYDTRYEVADFSLYNGREDGWGACRYDDIPKGVLKKCNMPPVRIIRTVPAVSVTNCSGVYDGAWIIDMGENFAGFAEFHLPRCVKGAQYVFRYAEALNEGGHMDYRSGGSYATWCIQQDIYIARGDAEGEVYCPRFTYHGFRYIEVTGYYNDLRFGMDPDPGFAVGYAISTDLKETGAFSCDHDDLMRFHKIMKNTFSSNFHGFPEDCPAREKCGWLGDAQLVCNTGMMNYDLGASYEKYMQDIRTSYDVYGTWKMIAPGQRTCGDATPLWGCAQIIIPYYMYRYLGNRTVVRDHLDRMEEWVAHELNRSHDYVIDEGLGDWCPPGGNGHPRRMPVKHSSTMMFFEVCDKMAKLCDWFSLGEQKREYYKSLSEKIKASIIAHFYNKERHSYGYWGSDGVALLLGIYPEGERELLRDALCRMIEAEDFEPHTGIYANKYLVPALCEENLGDLALQVLFTPDHPSFRTMMDDGATTIWESYGMTSISPREKSVASYNHPMHGSFAYFYYAHIGGIEPIAPGFARFSVKPVGFDAISEVDVSYESPYGKIGVAYKRLDGKYAYTITIPPNTECEFTPIGGERVVLSSGVYKL